MFFPICPLHRDVFALDMLCLSRQNPLTTDSKGKVLLKLREMMSHFDVWAHILSSP